MRIIKTLGKSFLILKIYNMVYFRFRFGKLVEFSLKIFPIKLKFKNSESVVRCKNFETFFIADEIFNRGFYEDILSKDIETFLDLGCNMGTFTVYLKHFLNRKDIKGILIDANSECEQEVLWHIKENELNSVYFYNGLVTYNDYLTEGRFYINESDAASSMYAEHDPNEPKTFYTKKLIVPYVNVIKIWEEVFPNKRCNLLKIDIEGSEKEFVVKENIFFEITDAILLEWHGWVISLEELENRLLLMGFKLKKIIEDRESRGVAYFEREKKVF